MASYTAADADRVFAQDKTEVHAYFARLAAEQRPAVRRAIANLTGTIPPAEEDTGPALDSDSDDQDAELDPDGDTEHSGGES